jgi:hypothetical protein
MEDRTMADTVKVNGHGMTEAEIEKIVARELKWKTKNERNKVAARLLKAKIAEAGIKVTEAEIDAAIAEQRK